MSRIIALMVTHNEADRYLEETLCWLLSEVDTIFVYDDRSTDNTAKILDSFKNIGVRWNTRGPHDVSFLQHEGRFRTAALRDLEKFVRPTLDDWVFVADADEFFVAHTDTLRGLTAYAESHHVGIRLRIHSVWEQQGRKLLHRVDGPWSTLFEPRLWRWREAMAFADKAMACRNEPVFVTMNQNAIIAPQTGSAILHYGYANERDRAHRFKRYSALPDHGHNPKFIESIVDTDVELLEWPGRRPADVI